MGWTHPAFIGGAKFKSLDLYFQENLQILYFGTEIVTMCAFLTNIMSDIKVVFPSQNTRNPKEIPSDWCAGMFLNMAVAICCLLFCKFIICCLHNHTPLQILQCPLSPHLSVKKIFTQPTLQCQQKRSLIPHQSVKTVTQDRHNSINAARSYANSKLQPSNG